MEQLTNEQITIEADALSAKLLNVKQSLQDLTTLKNSIEEKLLSLYGERARENRTVHILTDNYEIKVENATTTKIDSDKLLNILTHGDTLTHNVAERIFKYEPKLIKKEWDVLEPSTQALFYDCITTKASSPRIEVKEKEKN